MRNRYLLLLTLVFFTTLTSCYKIVEIDYNYDGYSRVVGPEGGQIVFYANYGNDSGMFFVDSANILVEMNFPAGALDTDMVFNFYQFQDYDIASELSKGLANVGSKFIYFVPVFASDGYHEHDDADLTYHLSVDFNQPVSVTYHFKIEEELSTIDQKKMQFEFYDWFNANYKLYKVEIPKIDEWGEQRNIFVQWNQQGYPVGYYQNDLKDIILGYWFPNNYDNDSYSSIVNWEVCNEFEIDPVNMTVSFDMNNTDYMYVLSRVIEITLDKLPFKIKDYISSNFSSNILRAAIIDKNFQVILEDRTIVYFDIASNFLYAEKYNLQFAQIPNFIINYLQNNYPNDLMQGNIVEYYEDYSIYKMNLLSSQTLFFIQDSLSVEYLGSMQYDFDFNSLPQNVIDYINVNYPDASVNSITNYNSQGEQEISVYLSFEGKNIMVHFGNSGAFLSAVYYGLKTDDITSEVNSFLHENYQNIDIVKITQKVDADSNMFSIQLINETDIDILDNGELINLSSFILSNDLPDLIKTTLQNTFSSSNIVFCYYLFHHGEEDYGIEFLEGLYVEIFTSGEIEYAGGSNFDDLKDPTKAYIVNNYSENQFGNFDYYNADFMAVPDYYYFVYLKDGTLIVFDKNGNYYSSKISVKRKEHQKLWDKKSKN
ncbi:MAG: PepSY-like domain-containing protein [Bacteroidales bacterium]|nr:PepSY-like domain-containing protein [Bacteroidales bacterium]